LIASHQPDAPAKAGLRLRWRVRLVFAGCHASMKRKRWMSPFFAGASDWWNEAHAVIS
jgi:hypothetical protein